MAIDRDGLLNFFEQEFGIERSEINDETLLFTDGLLDSLSVASLVIYLEQAAAFQADPTDITLDNLDSVDRILAYVQSKSG